MDGEKQARQGLMTLSCYTSIVLSVVSRE